MIPNLKITYACRQLTDWTLSTQPNDLHRQPRTGDAAVFEVLSLGKHDKVQSADKTMRHILPGDYILAAFGPRYASAQFEGYVPDGPREVYHILGQGGAIGELASSHVKFAEIGPTCLRLVGYAVDVQGSVVNTRQITHYAPYPEALPTGAPLILSVGASMDSGKTTSAAYLARGLSQGGHRVAFIKLTGTIFSKDADLVRDMGACISLDFSEMGYPSTFQVPTAELLALAGELLQRVALAEPDYIVMEIADGLLQQETAALLMHPVFRARIDHLMFSCGDSLSALGGLQWLQQHQLQPFALAGLITCSPLLTQEVRAITTLPILDLEALADPSVTRWFQPATVRMLATPPLPVMAARRAG